MANPEHVEIVKRGAAAIAEWRRKHPGEGLNLKGAFLGGTDLSGANLRLADLSGANLSGVALSGADLSAANLRGAWLDGANVTGANLTAADLFDAVSGSTLFANCDLNQVGGLECVHHRLPSTIGVDTLTLTLQGSAGQFTTAQRTFFEEAGVPRTLLEYLPDLLETQPIQFFSCFISYGGEDDEFADRLHRGLRRRDIRCWKYDVDALIGREVWGNISRAIVLHEKMIIICSESSLQRPGVLGEIERALQKEEQLQKEKAERGDAEMDTDFLVPVRLDNYILHDWEHPRKADVIKKHIGDFRGWDEDEKKYDKEIQRLLHALDPRSRLGLSKGDLRELEQG